DGALVPRAHRPGDPADEAVDRVAGLALAERQLVPRACELVGAVLDPVGPRHEQLPPPGAGHLLRSVAVQQLATAGLVGAQAGTHLRDHDAVIPGAKLDLLPGRRAVAHPAPMRSSRWSPTRREFAIAVSAGLTAPIDGKTLVSTTYRLSTSCARQSAFSTDVAGSVPKRQVPAW